MTGGYIGLQVVTTGYRGYRRLQWVTGVTRGYIGLQKVTEDYKGLQGFKRCYKEL